jgi:hypothetical protein
VTLREREDRFIEKCKKDFGGLTWESEMLLRHGFASGAQELADAAYVAGVDAQREHVLGALGAAPRKVSALP